MKKPVKAQPIPLATATPTVGAPGRVVGWGNTCDDPSDRTPSCYPANLQEADAQLIRFLYFDGQKHTEAQLASILGISQPAVHKRKIEVLSKIFKIVGY